MSFKVNISINILFFNKLFNSDNSEENRFKRSCALDREGVSLFNKGEYKDALVKFIESNKVRPHNCHSNFANEYLGLCYFELGYFHDVLNHNYWKNLETKFYYKCMSSYKIEDFKTCKSFIDAGRTINFTRFQQLREDLFHPADSILSFSSFLDANTIFQLLRNIDEDDLNTNDISKVELLNEIKSTMLSPHSLNKNSRNRLKSIHDHKALELFLLVDLQKLLSKKVLILNERILVGKNNYYTYFNEKFITDLTFLKYFNNLNAITLFGQNKLTYVEILKDINTLKEININQTNISPDIFNQQELVFTQKGTSGLHSFSEYPINKELEEKSRIFQLNLKLINNKVKTYESSYYPKVFFPLEFDENPKNFKNIKVLQPKFTNEIHASKGITEVYFKNHLLSFFDNDEIFDNMCVYEFNKRLPYFPDFSFVHEYYSLYIDIEIDEPYTIIDKQETHFISSDDYRNAFFLLNNWFIIRFTEEQIVNHPRQCCILIDKFQKHIIECFNNGYKEFSFNFPQLISPWTKEESAQMASNNYREAYLKKMKII